MTTEIAFDLETWLMGEGCKAPPAVVGSFATEKGAWMVRPLGSPDPGPSAGLWLVLQSWLRPGVTISGLNVAFDFAVACADEPELIPYVFDHYQRSGRPEDGGVFDVAIALTLDGIARGRLLEDSNGAPLRSIRSDGTEGGRAKNYSLALASRLLLNREGVKSNDTYKLRYGELSKLPTDEWPAEARQYPLDDAINTLDCRRVILARSQSTDPAVKFYGGLGDVWRFRPTVGQSSAADRFGWTHHQHQVRAAFAMQLAAVNGIRTDPAAVEALAERAEREHRETIALLQAEGLTHVEDGEVKKRRSAVQARVAIAYGTDPLSQCSACAGTGKVPSPKTGKQIQCKACSATGLELAPAVPRTPADGVAADRVTLEDSGDPVLERLAEADAKTHETYVPFLRKASKGHPVCVDFNSLLVSGRASWSILQTLPKTPGVRECIIPEPGYYFVSVDYAALEFATLAQACLMIVGDSRIAQALNNDEDPHVLLGSRMVGVSYAEFQRARKDPRTKDLFDGVRGGSKAGNFGFGGLMGPPRFTATQRRNKLFVDAQGREHGSMCRVLGREESGGCGSEKITEWKRRPIAPLCRACVEVSAELKAGWLDTWPETTPYFEWIQSLPGIEDGEGVIVSPGTGFIRGGLTASEAANHPFQHLASMGAKHALWNVTREMYDRRLGSPLLGSRVAVFAHDEIVAQVPIETAHEASYRLRDVMVASMREFVPDVKIKAEPALMRRWYKKAEPEHDASGRLIPWEPKGK